MRRKLDAASVPRCSSPCAAHDAGGEGEAVADHAVGRCGSMMRVDNLDTLDTWIARTAARATRRVSWQDAQWMGKGYGDRPSILFPAASTSSREYESTL